MKGRELIQAAMRFDKTEATPWVPFVGCHAGALLGIPANSELGRVLHLGCIWSLIDTANILTVHANITRVVHQVRVADEVILNKIDLVDQKILDTTAEEISKFNPYVRVTKTSYCAADITLRSTELPTAFRRVDEHSSLKPGKRPAVGSATLRTHETITEAGLNRFLSDYGPKCYRLKGCPNVKRYYSFGAGVFRTDSDDGNPRLPSSNRTDCDWAGRSLSLQNSHHPRLGNEF